MSAKKSLSLEIDESGNSRIYIHPRSYCFSKNYPGTDEFGHVGDYWIHTGLGALWVLEEADNDARIYKWEFKYITPRDKFIYSLGIHLNKSIESIRGMQNLEEIYKNHIDIEKKKNERNGNNHTSEQVQAAPIPTTDL